MTPSLGVIAALLILIVVREPPRGHTDGQRSSKGVRGKSGVKAYLMDVYYCLKKLVPSIVFRAILKSHTLIQIVCVGGGGDEYCFYFKKVISDKSAH